MADREQELFGGGVGLDVSDEALEDKWEPDPTQADPDESHIADSEGDETPSEEEEQPSEEETPAPAEDQDEGDPEPQASDDDLPEDLRGKTPAELAKIIEDSRSMVAKQSNDVGDMRKQLEEQQTQYQQLAQQIAYMQSVESTDDVMEGAIDNPVQAYRTAIDLLDQGKLDIGTVEQVIDHTYEQDPALARKMERDFAMRLAVAQSSARIAPLEEQQKELSKREASNALYHGPNSDPDTEAYQQDILDLLLEKPRAGDPTAFEKAQLQQAYASCSSRNEFEAVFRAALRMAKGIDPTRTKAYRDAVEARKVDATVETGGGDPPPATVSPEDAIRNEIYGSASRQRANPLFAPLEKLKQ